MNKLKIGVFAAVLSTFLVSMGAIASELGVSAAAPGPGGGGGVPVYGPTPGPVYGGGGCYYAYHIRKIFGPEHAGVGDEIKYKIFLTNIGNCDLRRIRVQDFLPDHTEFVSADPEPTWVKDEHLVWDDVRLEEGDRQIFEIRAKIKDHDCPDHRFSIVNKGCAYTPWIGTQICDFATTWIDRDHDHTPAS